jgi:hypothetical protein
MRLDYSRFQILIFSVDDVHNTSLVPNTSLGLFVYTTPINLYVMFPRNNKPLKKPLSVQERKFRSQRRLVHWIEVRCRKKLFYCVNHFINVNKKSSEPMFIVDNIFNIHRPLSQYPSSKVAQGRRVSVDRFRFQWEIYLVSLNEELAGFLQDIVQCTDSGRLKSKSYILYLCIRYILRNKKDSRIKKLRIFCIYVILTNSIFLSLLHLARAYFGLALAEWMTHMLVSSNEKPGVKKFKEQWPTSIIFLAFSTWPHCMRALTRWCKACISPKLTLTKSITKTQWGTNSKFVSND